MKAGYRGLACAALLFIVSPAVPAMAEAAQPAPAPRPPGVEIALARVKQVRAVIDAMRVMVWEQFDPVAFPAVLHQPGGWAVAIGFPEPPGGFSRLEGVTDEGRPIDVAPAGVFTHRGRSPARVAGRWAVISRFEPPRSIVGGDYLGRPVADEAIAQYVGDAFLLYLMQVRKTDRPYPVGVAAYPESAELMAATDTELRLIQTGIKMPVNNNTLEEFHKRIRQLIAVRRARVALMGPEVAAMEQEIELTDGLGIYAASMVPRLALSGKFEIPDTRGEDITFERYGAAMLQRMMLINFPLIRLPDNPASSPAQVASRGAALAFLLEHFAKMIWRTNVLKGDQAFLDIAQAEVPLKPEDEPALLDAARADFRYDAALRQANEDLQRCVREQEASVSELRASRPRWVTIKMAGGRAGSYQDDPLTSSNLGKGRILHATELRLEAKGLQLDFRADSGPDGVVVLTQAGARRDQVTTIWVGFPADPVVALGGGSLPKRQRDWSLSDASPLSISHPEIRLDLKRGRGIRDEKGNLEISLANETPS